MRALAVKVLSPAPPWRWLVWSAFVVGWTASLLIPIPVKAEESGLKSREVLFYFAKTVHVSAYALFAVLTGWLRVPARQRCWLLAFLLAHAAGTELLQALLETGRTGRVQDALLNTLGITAGMVLSWRWWRPAREPLAA
jgi:VanZ family protein